MEDFRLSGLVAATFTPMKPNGDVDYDRIDAYCQFLVDEGVTQYYINGTTGEGPSLTVEERMRIIECWVKAGKKDGRSIKIVVQVGGTCLKDSVIMAKHAESLGVAAISTLPPLYYPVSTTQDLVDHVKTISAAAPNTPMFYYHFPMRSGVNINMEQFLIDSRDVIPTLRGIKFTDKDLVMMCACLRTKDTKGRNFNIVFGCDEQMMGALALGADGAIGSTFNWMSAVYRRIAQALEKGDLATALKQQHLSQDVVKCFFKYAQKTNGIIITQKDILALVGMDLGCVRAPFRMLQPKDREDFFNELKGLGLLEWRK